MKYCKGIRCHFKNTCLRYTEGIGQDGEFITHCTNQKKYIKTE